MAKKTAEEAPKDFAEFNHKAIALGVDLCDYILTKQVRPEEGLVNAIANLYKTVKE